MRRRLIGSIRNKLLIHSAVIALPFLCTILLLILSMANYSKNYDSIVSSMTVANNYNLNFKEEMDESIYKIVVGYTTFEDIVYDDKLRSPYEILSELRREFQTLEKKTTEEEGKVWVTSLLRNIDALEKRIDDIKENIKSEGENYSDNISMLDTDIYILTELIQEDIQYYLFYQTRSIEKISDSLNNRMEQFIKATCIIVMFMVLAVVIETVITVSRLLHPVDVLYHATGKIAEGDFSARADVKSGDELEVLAEGFNNMATNMQTLIDEIKEDEQKMRQMDLRLLQEQINPHFLYNTLDTIVWLIEGNETEQAVEMVVTLSNFFRMVLSGGKDMISIREEEQHIRSYLEIQKMRYGDIMEYNISIDKVLYDYQILKLTLQPLIENALYHGIKHKRAKGYVHVTGEKENDLIRLSVRDNGVGMDSDELEKLRKAIQMPCSETDKGFGLANVNERIRNCFGQEYGMKIKSEKGYGTMVEIEIPARRCEVRENKNEEGN